ncbi:unnamed protein product [Rhizophagus irregularis]|nr:unnamed protein product [Rhizophagus irregularis]
MGSSGEVNNIDETKIYGVMPYVAPEVLRGRPYTKAADIYSFGMMILLNPFTENLPKYADDNTDCLDCAIKS